MKLGLLTTTHIALPVQLGLLRVLVDSVRAHVPRAAYETFVVADDCSPEAPAGPYYAWLAQEGIAEVYRMGPPRRAYTSSRTAAAGGGGAYSFGHATGLMAGFARLRAHGCTHAWILDGDCAVVDPTMAGRLPAILGRLAMPRVAVVTDYFAGRMDGPEGRGTAVADATVIRVDGDVIDKGDAPCKAAWALHGFPVLFCAVVDLAVEERFGFLNQAGWVNSRWGYRLFRQGYRVAYFPFFQGGHVFHLGFGFSREHAGLVTQTYGNAVETARYGGKALGIYHAGYLQLARTLWEHGAWLGWAGGPPYDALRLMPPDWLVRPAPNPLAGGEDSYLRPLRPSDYDGLRAIDADPEATRFLSWGPHGPEQTRAFLARASESRWRWFAWVDRGGRLIGYGEIKPLGVESGNRVAGVIYVIARPAWRRGHGTALCNALAEAAYNQLDIAVLEAAIDTENTASFAVLKKTGREWVKTRTEPYTLKGAARTRVVYRCSSSVRPAEPPEDPAACHVEREALLDGIGVWR